MSVVFYALLLLGTGVERLWELRISRRNAAWAFARGGREYGQRHFPWMVALHTLFIVACFVEVVALDRPFLPLLGGIMVVVALACQGLRYWIIRTLGPQWNTRVIVVPGAPRVTGGPYRFMSHPNYWVVVIEGIALPLVHSAWITAVAFTVLNAILLLGFRIPVENRALAQLTPGHAGVPAKSARSGERVTPERADGGPGSVSRT